MKHLAKIQSEFLKCAIKWDELSRNQQKKYLQKHKRSRKRLTAKPRQRNYSLPRKLMFPFEEWTDEIKNTLNNKVVKVGYIDSPAQIGKIKIIDGKAHLYSLNGKREYWFDNPTQIIKVLN